MTDSPGLVDVALRLVNSVLLQVKFFREGVGEFKLQRNCIKFCLSFLRLGNATYMFAQRTGCKTDFLWTLLIFNANA